MAFALGDELALVVVALQAGLAVGSGAAFIAGKLGDALEVGIGFEIAADGFGAGGVDLLRWEGAEDAIEEGAEEFGEFHGCMGGVFGERVE